MFVATVKVAVDLPSATVTLVGAEATLLSLASVITAPLGGAIPLRVTVPVEENPPATVVGLRVTE